MGGRGWKGKLKREKKTFIEKGRETEKEGGREKERKEGGRRERERETFTEPFYLPVFPYSKPYILGAEIKHYIWDTAKRGA